MCFFGENQLLAASLSLCQQMGTVIKYNRLKSVLADKSVTNIQLAGHLGISKNTVSRWNNQIVQPSIPTLHRIADFLRVSIFDLLEEMPYEIEVDEETENE